MAQFIVEVAQDEHREAVGDFVENMLAGWQHDSSLQTDGVCCPSRTIRAVREQVVTALDEGESLILARDGGKVVGIMVLDLLPQWQKSAGAGLLNIHPELRRAGLAKMIFGHAIHHLARLGYRSMRFETWSANQPGRRLFAETGCIATGEADGVTSFVNHLPKAVADLEPAMAAEIRDGRFHAACDDRDGLIAVSLTADGRDVHRLLLPN